MRYVKGNLLDAKEQVIIHGCNAQGVMGSGVAAAIRNKWPEAYTAYKEFQKKFGFGLGTYSAYVTPEKQIIVNLITQKYYGSDGNRYVSYAGLAVGLDRIIEDSVQSHVNKGIAFGPHFGIALPKIGAGLGGGDWEVIESLLLDLEEMWEDSVEFVVYEI